MPAGPVAGTAFLNIKPDLTSLSGQMGAFAAGPKWSKWGKVAGGALAAGVAAAGIGKVLFDIGKDFDDAFDKIRVGTGATGKQLERLKGDFKNVIGSVPADFEDASIAVADLNTRLGLSGKPLRQMSKQMTELSRITKTDMEGNVESVAKAFVDWEVKTKDQSKTLDGFFRLSQESGMAVADIAESIQKFGSPLRQLGFTLEESAAMFAQFERAGVNTQTMVPGLKLAISNLTRPTEGLAVSMKKLGIETGKPDVALRQIFDLLGDGSTLSQIDRTGLAMDVFGKRAGADMAEAIKQGRFELDDFLKVMEGGKETIRGAGRDTMDLSEHWQVFTNRLKTFVEPVATKVFEGLGDAMGALNKALASEGFKKFTADVKEALRDLRPVFQFFGDVAGKAIGGVIDIFKGFARTVKGVTQVIGGVLTLDFQKVWDGLKNIVGGTVDGMIGAVKTLTTPFRAVFGGIAGFVEGSFDRVKDAATDVVNFVIDRINNLIDAQNALPFVPDIGPLERIGKDIELDFGVKTEKQAKKVEKAMDQVRGALRKTTPFWDGHGQQVKDTTRGVERDTDRAADKGSGNVQRLAKNADRASGRMKDDVSRNVGGMVGASLQGIGHLTDQTSKALKAFGVDPLNFTVKGLAKGAANLFSGGLFRNRGGDVPGVGNQDTVPAMLTPGEFVINAKDTARARPLLEAINAGKFAKGGIVPVPGFPGEQINSRVMGAWQALQKRFNLFLTDAYGPGHASAEHTQYGTAVDVVPGPGGSWGQVGAAVAHSVRAGYTPVYYDGSGGSINLPPHGPGHHAHITLLTAAELLSGKSAGGAAMNLAKLILQGPAGPLRDMGQGALDKVRAGAQKFINSKMMAAGAHGPVSAPEGVLSGPQLQSLWSRQNPDLRSVSRLMAMIALGESSGNPRAVGHDPGGTTGLGLWQITTGFNDDLIRKYGGVNKMFVPGINAMAAGDIYRRQGRGAWYAPPIPFQRGGPIDSYKYGGTVPGPVGAPRPAIVHGGEHITPPGQELRLVRGKLSIDESGVAFIEGIAEDVVYASAPDTADYASRELGKNWRRSEQLRGRG